ncbi:MAG TPA: ROK family transcriptional regulator [Acidimicrobiales bacterium]|nr:ROK family transcriptional regulator [Acidimicrobiales bacterium]
MAGDEELSTHGIRRGDRRLMAEMNRNLVFNVLRTGAVSRADVVRTTGLSPATVSAIVSELIESGLVNDMGQGKSRGGRPPLVLRINDERNYAVGLKIMRRGVFIVVTDIRAEVLYSEMVELDWGPVTDDRTLSPRGAHDAGSVLERICLAIEEAADRAGVGMGKVVGIGIGLSGLIEPGTGTCRYTPLFGWTDVQVAGPIAKRLDRPVLVENDCNALTVAEQWFGRGHGMDDFVVVAVGEGVGAGIVIDGNLYRGADGAAGEIGHLPVAGATRPCSCGRYGCLEAVSSDHAVLEYVQDAIAEGEKSSLSSTGPSNMTVEAVRIAAEAGDAVATAALQRAGHMLGLGIAALVNLLNPRLVILSGQGALAGPFLEAVFSSLREHCFAGIGRNVDFLVGSVDDVAWARGAACLVLGELFSSPVHRSVELAPRRPRRAVLMST